MAGHLDLRQRLQTFVALVSVTALLLTYHPPTLALTILAISIDEYHRCIRQLPYAIQPVAATAAQDRAQAALLPYTTGSRAFHVLCALLIGLSALWGPMALTAATVAVNGYILTHSLVVNRATDRPLTTAALVMIADMFGHVYLSYMWSHAQLFFTLPHHWFGHHPVTVIVYTVVTVVAGENGALFVGRAIGRHKLAPAISPNKSIEGAVSQLVSTVVVSNLFAAQFLDPLTAVDSLVLGAMIGSVAIIGDLFESFLKRAVNVKDVGALLPGTGGFLDRVDGLTLCFPVVYYYITLRFGQ